VSVDDTAGDPGRLRLVSIAATGLSERLAGRVDEHLARFAAHMTQGLVAASTTVGLEVMAELMDVEVTGLAGPKGKHDSARVAMRHGSQPGTGTLGGRRVGVRRPRVRTIGEDIHEVQLESYTAFTSTDLLAEGIVARMLPGAVDAPLPRRLEPVGEQVDAQATGSSKSAVSRRSVATTAERLSELLDRRLDQDRWLMVFLDGFGRGEHLLVGALGVTADGTKVPSGWWRAPPRTPRSPTRLVADLAERGLDASRGCCSSSTAARRWIGPSEMGSAPRRWSNGVAATRSATSPSTCPRPSGRWSSGGCAPPGPPPTPTRPPPNSSSSPAAWPADGPALLPACVRGWPRR
jgi:hypothetical protein